MKTRHSAPPQEPTFGVNIVKIGSMRIFVSLFLESAKNNLH